MVLLPGQMFLVLGLHYIVNVANFHYDVIKIKFTKHDFLAASKTSIEQLQCTLGMVTQYSAVTSGMWNVVILLCLVA